VIELELFHDTVSGLRSVSVGFELLSTPAAMLFPWFVYAFACFSVAVFFCVFNKAQS
jgi:hypothetical protein